MSDPTVRGIVHVVEETKTYGQKGFQKRLFVLEQNDGRYTNYVPLELVQDNCHLADNLSVGDEVEVVYRLSGRKWQRDSNSEVKYFLNAEALRFNVLSQKPAANPEDAAAAFAEAEAADADYGEEEIPF